MSASIEHLSHHHQLTRRWRRDAVERLLDLARHLPERDRVLIDHHFRHGLPATDIAVLTGQPPRAVQRYLARLVRDLRHPLYQFLHSHGDIVSSPVRRTAETVIFHRRSLRQAANDTGQSLHRVREHMREVKALARLTK